MRTEIEAVAEESGSGRKTHSVGGQTQGQLASTLELPELLDSE